MGENSAIEWTDHTWNPWIGCTRVSQGCVHCYAEALAKRYSKAEWGPTAQRVRTSEANWRKPLQWNRKAEQEGVRRRVFCASLADIFEDNDQLTDWRKDGFDVMAQTPWLDWLLLTKRPENILDMVPDEWRTVGRWPRNVWTGTTIEHQSVVINRLSELIRVPAPVRFLSCEPLLGPLDLAEWLDFISWVIVGGESGQDARGPMHPDWPRSLLHQCQEANVPFLFKQWGQFVPVGQTDRTWYNSGQMMYAADKHTAVQAIRLKSKHDAGRQLDGREWNEFPEVPA